MTSKPAEYYYTISNPCRIHGIGGIDSTYPDVNAVIWNGSFCSVKEAVEHARLAWRAKYGNYPEHGSYVAVAPLTRFIPTVDVYYILENIRRGAYDVGGWDARGFVSTLDEITIKDREELRNDLQAVLDDWLKEHDLVPRFGVIKKDDCKYYPLWEGATL